MLRALSALNHGKKHHKDYRLNLISMALRGKKVSFDKVLGMIDDMSALLKKEQASDDKKKAYCEKAISEHEENIKAVSEEITSLTNGIKTLDKNVAEATAQRKAENAEYQETMQSDGAAKELIGLAKNRMAKFYNPKMYKAAPARKMSEAERISVNMGGTLAPTA